MKKLNISIITAVTALSLTVPAFAAPTYTTILKGENSSMCGTVKGFSFDCKEINCGFNTKEDIFEYIKNNCGVANIQKPDNGGSEDTCTDGSCEGGNDCTQDNTCNGGSGNNGNTDNNGGNNNENSGNNGNNGGNNGNNGSNNGNNGSEKPDASVSSYAKRVVELVNEERAKEGLSPLSIDSRVTAAAAVRAEEIKTSFSHTRPDGRTCFTALEEAGASYKGAGENIAYGQKTPEEVVSAWMNSEGHRKNIMSKSFTHIGVAYSNTAWVQMFTY